MPLDPKTNAQIAALAPVQSVNGETGAVSLSAADVSAQASDATLSALAAWDWSSGTEVPTFTADDTLAILRVGTGANNLVQLDGTSKLPAVDGSALTNIPAGTVADGSITNAKLANVATATIKGRTTAGTGVPEDLSASQARTVLGLGTAALSAATDFAPAIIVDAITSDFTWSGTSGVYQTLLTITLPTTGRYHVQYFGIGYHTVSLGHTPRLAEGTCVFSHGNGEIVGLRSGGNTSGTVASVAVTTGSPNVAAAATLNTNSYSYHHINAILDVTTAGTLLAQVQFALTGSGPVIFAGAHLEAVLLP